MSELKRETALREISVGAVPVNDDDDLDAFLSGGILEETAIADMVNMLQDNIDTFSDDWSLDEDSIDNTESFKSTELITDHDRLQQELEAMRSQYQFECEYVDQLEQEIISVTNDRDRQAEEFDKRLAIALEIATQKITKQYIQEINDKTELLHQLQCQNTALDISQQTLTTELEATQALLKESTKTLEVAQIKLAEVITQRDQFEEELIQHLSNQAKLHQSLRGLENEYVNDLTRVQELEQQIEELQNQVLHQSSKASEYEAAIQHWKEQSVRHQHHALQLSGALDRLLVEKPVKHLTQPTQHSREPVYEQDYNSVRSPESLPATTPATTPVRSPRPSTKVDLPAFLVRNR